MLALVRPGAWNLPLFLHVLGATLAFGSIATVAIVGFAGHRADGNSVADERADRTLASPPRRSDCPRRRAADLAEARAIGAQFRSICCQAA